ncbi:MAG: hypothetical protein HYW86_05105 [Candidatus Roizmanbacteria bacterium]|nr:MAG: hypothetical protein HYW86_05105 [Candidatus Roizmanbacteria bacterium]
MKTKENVNTKFTKTESSSIKNSKERLLFRALLAQKNEQEMADLLRDLLTLPEIEEFSNRLEIARQLREGHSYLNVAHKVGTSTTTVTRVAHWLFKGCGGYYRTLKKLIK